MINNFLLTYEQTASELDCSISTINRLIKQNKLTKVYLTPGNKRGGCPRITKESIERYLASLCHQPYSRSCTEASATQLGGSVWQHSTKERTRPTIGAGGNVQTAQELGEKLGIL